MTYSPKTEHLKATQWKKGQSGNPAGRAKGGKLLSTTLKNIIASKFSKKYTSIITDEETELTGGEIIASRLFADAADGDLAAIKEIFDRVDGKVPDKLAGDEDEPLRIILEKVDKSNSD